MQSMSQGEVKEWLKNPKNIKDLLPNFVMVNDILAIGGQGVVFFGEVKGNDAAIKIYFPGQLQQRIDREVSALEKMNCDTLVKLLWHDTIPVCEYQLSVVATELINGMSLDNLSKQRMISFDELGIIVYDISKAIDVMWSHRIVHRDIKPSNILIRTDSRACVIDLGVARHLDESSLTARGYTWGTLGYMSPEQANSARQLTCKSDIYALGILIAECSLNRHPSGGDQMKLFGLGLDKNLPEPLNSWEHSGFIRSMFDFLPVNRPMPQDLIKAFKQYKREDN